MVFTDKTLDEMIDEIGGVNFEYHDHLLDVYRTKEGNIFPPPYKSWRSKFFKLIGIKSGDVRSISRNNAIGLFPFLLLR